MKETVVAGAQGAVPEKKSRRNIKKMLCMLAVMAVAAVMIVFPAFAESTNMMNSSITGLVKVLCSIFRYVGFALFAWAIVMFILATKRGDADSKADAIQTAGCGAALMLVPTILDAIGITGSTGANLGDVSGDIFEGD